MKTKNLINILMLIALFFGLASANAGAFSEDGGNDDSYYFLGTTIIQIQQREDGTWTREPGSWIDDHSWSFDLIRYVDIIDDPALIEIVDVRPYDWSFTNEDSDRVFMPKRYMAPTLEDYNENYRDYSAFDMPRPRELHIHGYEKATSRISLTAHYAFRSPLSFNVGANMNEAYMREFNITGRHEVAMIKLKEKLRELYEYQVADPDAAIRGENLSETFRAWFESLNAYEPEVMRSDISATCSQVMNNTQAYYYLYFDDSFTCSNPSEIVVNVGDVVRNPQPDGSVVIMNPARDIAVVIFPYVVEFKINKEANTLIANKYNNASIQHNDKTYDRIEVRRVSADGPIDAVINNTHDASASVVEGERLMLSVYLQRENMPLDPKADNNPVKIKDISFTMNETVNELVNSRRDLKNAVSKYSNTIYKNTFTHTRAQLPQPSKISVVDPLSGQQTPFVDYDAAIHGEMKLEAGTIIRYDLMINVPRTGEIMNPHSMRYKGSESYNNFVLNEWGIQFDMVINNDNRSMVNNVLTDDWSRIRLNVVNEEPCMTITQLIIRSETGTEMGRKELLPDGTIRQTPSRVILSPSENYQVETRTRWRHKAGEVSINSNLRTLVYVSYDGLPPENPQHARFRATSNLIEKWNHNQTGFYTPRTQTGQEDVSVANYYPNKSFYSQLPDPLPRPEGVETSSWNPMVLPIRYYSVSRGTVFAAVPDMYANNDNRGYCPPNTMSLEFFVEDGIDNAVVNIQLFDSQDREYNERNDDGTFSMHPNENYYAIITLRRVLRDGEPYDVAAAIANYDFEVNFRDRYDANRRAGANQMQIISPRSVLERQGDEVQVRVNNLYSRQGFLEIKAEIKRPDINLTNNVFVRTWTGYYNFAVSDFIITPSTLNPDDCDAATPRATNVNLSWTAVLVAESFADDKDGNLNIEATEVPIEIKDHRGQVAYRGEVDFTSFRDGRSEITVSGMMERNDIPINYTLDQGAHTFRIAINGGRSEGGFWTRRYREWTPNMRPYEDNLKEQDVLIAQCPPPSAHCTVRDQCRTGGHLENNWSQSWNMTERYGCSTQSYTGQCCSGEAPNRQCNSCSGTRCVGCQTRRWIETRSFYERLAVTMKFRSAYTMNKYGDFRWITVQPGTSGHPDGKVHSRQWYEFYIETHFITSRDWSAEDGGKPVRPIRNLTYANTIPTWSDFPQSFGCCGGSSYCHRQSGSSVGQINNVQRIYLELEHKNSLHGHDECYDGRYRDPIIGRRRNPIVPTNYQSMIIAGQPTIAGISGRWSNQYRRFWLDSQANSAPAVPSPGRHRVIDTTGVDGEIHVHVITEPFTGYIGDSGGPSAQGHPDYEQRRRWQWVYTWDATTNRWTYVRRLVPGYRNELQFCNTFVIKVQDPPPIRTDFIGE